MATHLLLGYLTCFALISNRYERIFMDRDLAGVKYRKVIGKQEQVRLSLAPNKVHCVQRGILYLTVVSPFF